jgi:hypothetical protein
MWLDPGSAKLTSPALTEMLRGLTSLCRTPFACMKANVSEKHMSHSHIMIRSMYQAPILRDTTEHRPIISQPHAQSDSYGRRHQALCWHRSSTMTDERFSYILNQGQSRTIRSRGRNLIIVLVKASSFDCLILCSLLRCPLVDPFQTASTPIVASCRQCGSQACSDLTFALKKVPDDCSLVEDAVLVESRTQVSVRTVMRV